MSSAPTAEARLLAELLERAGRAALDRFGTARAALKRDGSEVTEADLAASAILVEGLAAAFPGSAVISEEGGEAVAGSGGRWYIDPIDGTAAFLEGLPTWGPTVCFVDDGALTLGALHLPRVGEHWFADRDTAWRDAERLSDLPVPELSRRDSICVPSRFHNLPPFGWRGKVRCLGSSAIHLAQVAAGGSVATVIPFWELWDVGAGILLIEAVGGQIRTPAGEPLDPVASVGRPFVAGHPAALDHLTPLFGTLPEL